MTTMQRIAELERLVAELQQKLRDICEINELTDGT